MGRVGGVLLALWMTPVVGRLALEQFGGVVNRDVWVVERGGHLGFALEPAAPRASATSSERNLMATGRWSLVSSAR